MKTLTLLRHAKSGWDDAVQRDFDRPLNPKGQRAAALIGRHLRALDARFDHVVASPAIRVVETIEHVASGYGAPLEPVWDRRIYLASVSTLFDIIHGLPADAESVLLIGHNPGLEELTLLMVPEDGDSARGDVERKFPTASIAELHIDSTDWAAVIPASATLARFVRPRDLDPALGPDRD